MIKFKFLRCLTQFFEKSDNRRNFLHPDAASSITPVQSNANIINSGGGGGGAKGPVAPSTLYFMPSPSQIPSPPQTQNKNVPPNCCTNYHWPTSNSSSVSVRNHSPTQIPDSS